MDPVTKIEVSQIEDGRVRDKFRFRGIRMKQLAALLVTLAVMLTLPPAEAITTPPTTDKVLVIVVENHSYEQLKAGAPQIWALAQRYAYATDFTAITHPSLPNYIAITSGSTQGITDNLNPYYHKLTVPSVFGGAWANGRSARVIADGMGLDRCRQTNNIPFVVRHTGYPYYVNERDRCEHHMFDYRYYSDVVTDGRLPNVGLLIPSNAHNAHDGTLATADSWIAARIATAMAAPDWKAGRLTIVITADEDDKLSGNKILTVVIHPSLSHRVITTPLTLYSLSGLLSDFGHSPRLLNARTATAMAPAFGLVVQ